MAEENTQTKTETAEPLTVIKNQGKETEAWQLGAGSAKEQEMIDAGKIQKMDDGTYRVQSQETMNAAKEAAIQKVKDNHPELADDDLFDLSCHEWKNRKATKEKLSDTLVGDINDFLDKMSKTGDCSGCALTTYIELNEYVNDRLSGKIAPVDAAKQTGEKTSESTTMSESGKSKILNIIEKYFMPASEKEAGERQTIDEKETEVKQTIDSYQEELDKAYKELLPQYGEVAKAGDYFKVDGADCPYPNEQSWFEENHKHIEGDKYEQVPQPMTAYQEGCAMPEEVQWLIDNDKLTINKDNPDNYFNAELWGSPESAKSDATVVIYGADRDDSGKITSVDFNFVAKEEFDRTYSVVGGTAPQAQKQEGKGREGVEVKETTEEEDRSHDITD